MKNWKLNKTQALINKAYRKHKNNYAVCWTGGKDSTVLLSLIKKIDQQPKVVLLDSQKEFPQLSRFVKDLTKQWQLDLKTFKYESPTALKARENKIKALNQAIKKTETKCLFVAIRWDEHPARSQEKFVSQKKDHFRVHPLLHWTEKDIWDYIKKYKIPYCPLYDQGYRSLGEAPFTKKAIKDGGERSGRDQDKEAVMARLRALGYF